MTSEQAALPEMPAAPVSGGIWARYVSGGEINHGAWLRAVAEGQFVGTCRACGGYLVPLRPDERGGRIDYAAECKSCGAEVNAPGGRVARGSTRKSERRFT